MRAILVLAASLVGCSNNVCDRVADLRTDCGDPPSEAALAACRTTVRDCGDEDVELLEAYADCLGDGVERGECFVSDPEDPSTDPSAGCFGDSLIDADTTCASAVSSL